LDHSFNPIHPSSFCESQFLYFIFHHFETKTTNNGSPDWTSVVRMLSSGDPECLRSTDCLCAHRVRILFCFQKKAIQLILFFDISDLTKPAQLICKTSFDLTIYDFGKRTFAGQPEITKRNIRFVLPEISSLQRRHQSLRKFKLRWKNASRKIILYSSLRKTIVLTILIS
jgi:hypothetical protein